MDKVILMPIDENEGYFTNCQTVSLGEQSIQVRTALRQREREMLAIDICAATLVFDETSGLVYEGYNRDVLRFMCQIRHYTNLDTAPYDTLDGCYLLYDMFLACGAMEQILRIIENDMQHVQKIVDLLKTSSQRTFEHSHALSYQVQRAFASVLTTEDIAKTLAEASTVNNQMVDMLGAFKREQMPLASAGGNVVRFDKKSD